MAAWGFLPEPALSKAEGVEMTDAGVAHQCRNLNQASDRHSEP